MTIGSILPCSVLALLFLTACGGGDAKAPANSGAQTPSGQAPSAPGATDPKVDASQPAAKKPAAPVRVDMAMAKQLFSMAPAAPAVDNPPTPEKIALGKTLYHEKSLSKNGNISCASCHDLANYGQDGKATSPGSDGKNGARNTPTVYNAFRQFAQFWDGRATTVEEQSTGPMFNPVEHGVADEAELVAKISAKPELVAAFDKAFPGGNAVSAKNFQLAVGAFERTLVTRSKFEDALDGKAQLSNDEKLGLKTFMEVGCHSCHMGQLLGGSMYQKLGVVKPYPSKDEGRFEVTKSDADKFMFKVPQLLNVEKTAPYYHDGSIATLELAVKDMAEYQLGKTLKPEEIASIVAFMKTLTGPLPDLK
ncbi:MAG: cytochrome-c peroxidase [Planctomycetes bacterium]|jgi:cytochrome c peroxidase|nr:cytochrome-c peroxidase [Planctomycetota bacterium]